MCVCVCVCLGKKINLFLNFNWRLITLQCCGGFCRTLNLLNRLGFLLPVTGRLTPSLPLGSVLTSPFDYSIEKENLHHGRLLAAHLTLSRLHLSPQTTRPRLLGGGHVPHGCRTSLAPSAGPARSPQGAVWPWERPALGFPALTARPGRAGPRPVTQGSTRHLLHAPRGNLLQRFPNLCCLLPGVHSILRARAIFTLTG